jgi:hypothetical protein|tara:strand:- start:343 stop:549 length:207 start_codon:yes stop_codon:yes gene_type:complete
LLCSGGAETAGAIDNIAGSHRILPAFTVLKQLQNGSGHRSDKALFPLMEVYCGDRIVLLACLESQGSS